MRGQVGYWGSCKSGGLSIGFGPDMMTWLHGEETGNRVFVSVSKERQVIILPDADGGHVSYCGPSNHSHYRYLSSVMPDSLFLDIELPPFELFALDFRLEQGCITATLPEDHELPWPRLHLDCTTYEAEQLALEALQWRLNSLVSNGKTRFDKPEQRMPQRLHKLLPPGKYAECMATAKALSQGSTL